MAALIPGGSYALAMAAGQVAHRILAADKLSFLTEKVAKSVLLIQMDANVARNLEEMMHAHDEFDNILLGFREGKGTSGVDRERFVSVNNALKHVEELWAPYRVAIEEIVEAGSVDDAHSHMILDNDEALEHACHEVVRKLEEAYGDVDIDLALALALDFAGRQRMYTQKICKEIAFTALGKDADEHHKKFKKNATKFGKIIDALINGGNGMITMAKPPSSEAMSALVKLQEQWVAIEPTVTKLDSEAIPAVADIVTFCSEMDAIELTAEDVALQYENAIKATS
ncbi:Type IV pili methyl-accepting chemotaxis transducer N-term [Aliiroseovarius halocynthiae]|nr:type IV pili methyl-accepting chemotaxis transducer N-terminal domain-containing protein [Aliiroseovarius halocynthiae]SMR82101.1 Type IV pili methyl-accepting chemotaxis transducer N-term [Aliiroseovarius halocynthiae]